MKEAFLEKKHSALVHHTRKESSSKRCKEESLNQQYHSREKTNLLGVKSYLITHPTVTELHYHSLWVYLSSVCELLNGKMLSVHQLVFVVLVFFNCGIPSFVLFFSNSA